MTAPAFPRSRYGAVAVTLHWLTAAAILAQLASGWTMTALPRTAPLKFLLFQNHKSIGITILALSLLRLAWRLTHRPPPLPSAMPAWERKTAHAGHALLYLLLIALPLSGWAAVSASPLNLPTVLFGLLPLPALPVFSTLPDKAAASHLLGGLHGAGAWLLAVLLAGHVGAALRHHFLLRDDVLERMLPRLPFRRTP